MTSSVVIVYTIIAATAVFLAIALSSRSSCAAVTHRIIEHRVSESSTPPPRGGRDDRDDRDVAATHERG